MSKLIEVLLVIAILAILGVGTTIGVQSQMIKASDTKIKNDLITIRSAFIQYYDDTGCFPIELPNCGEDFKKNNTLYLKDFPCLKDTTPYAYEIIEAPGNNREGDKFDPLCPQWYKILTNLQNENDKSIDLIGCRRGCGIECNYNFGISSTNKAINEFCQQYDKYACTPSGYCQLYADPDISDCPTVFRDDQTCQGKCKIKENRCHDEKGKSIP